MGGCWPVRQRRREGEPDLLSDVKVWKLRFQIIYCITIYFSALLNSKYVSLFRNTFPLHSNLLVKILLAAYFSLLKMGRFYNEENNIVRIDRNYVNLQRKRANCRQRTGQFKYSCGTIGYRT